MGDAGDATTAGTPVVFDTTRVVNRLPVVRCGARCDPSCGWIEVNDGHDGCSRMAAGMTM